jgi:hypothetical protein
MCLEPRPNSKVIVDFKTGTKCYAWERFEVSLHKIKGWAVYAKVDVKVFDALITYVGTEMLILCK